MGAFRHPSIYHKRSVPPFSSREHSKDVIFLYFCLFGIFVIFSYGKLELVCMLRISFVSLSQVSFSFLLM